MKAKASEIIVINEITHLDEFSSHGRCDVNTFGKVFPGLLFISQS